MNVTILVKDFFEKNPSGQFSINTLKNCFAGIDVYSFLIKLENDNVLIRSKIDINGKPVTHWQLKGRINKFSTFDTNKLYKSLPRNHIKDINTQDNSNKNTTKEDREFSKFDLPLKFPQTSNFEKVEIISTKISQESGQQVRCLPPPRRLIERKESATVPAKSSETMNFAFNDYETKSDLISKPQEMTQACNKSLPHTNATLIDARGTLNDKKCKKESTSESPQNSVSMLYEFAQQKGISCQIDVVEIIGPSHKPKIYMAVTLNGRKFDKVEAPNKKEGKRMAADIAIKALISDGQLSNGFTKSEIRPEIQKDLINCHEIFEFKNSTSMFNTMSSLIYRELSNLLKQLSTERGKILFGHKVLASVVMHDEKHDTFRVVSLATGNRCISGDKISLHGRVLNDCHAEVVARRTFILFLYRQLSAHLSFSADSLDIFEDSQKEYTIPVLRCVKIKAHIKFHLYISTAPCGDGALFCNREKDLLKRSSEVLLASKHKPTFEHPVQGLLRSKIEGGEGTIPIVNAKKIYEVQSLDGILRGERLRTMSCSDKIARWNYLGLQGSLLSQFVEPIFLASVFLGTLFDAGHLCRALCCRIVRDKLRQTAIGRHINHPDLGYVPIEVSQQHTEKGNEFSVNWTPGLDVEIVNGGTGQLKGNESVRTCSRLSKASLFHQYVKLHRSTGRNQLVSRYTYRGAKDLSVEYDSRKLQLFGHFHELEYGSWIRKPSEQNEFKDTQSD